MIKAVLRDTSIQIHLRITRFSLVIMAHLRKMPGCLSLLLFSVTWKAVLRDLFHLSMQELRSIVFFDEVDFIHYDSFSLWIYFGCSIACIVLNISVAKTEGTTTFRATSAAADPWRGFCGKRSLLDDSQSLHMRNFHVIVASKGIE